MKYMLSIFILFSGVLLTFGQASISAVGGLNLSNFEGTNSNNQTLKPGMFLGLNYENEFMEDLSFGLGLLYNQKGTSTLYVPDGTTHIKLNYLSVPVFMSYNFCDKFYVKAGPEIGYLLNGRLKSALRNDIITDDYSRIDLALGASIGVWLTDDISLTAGYTHGLKDVSKATFPASKILTQNIQLGLQYEFY